MLSTETHETERRRLIRLCAYLTGSSSVAEDLAQETLLEAWRSERALRDPAKRQAWLTGIARNVCKRWRRNQARAVVPLAEETEDELLDRSSNLELELERDELALLLDRALSLLSPELRHILVARFVEDSSHAEIAQRLGLTEGAVKVRVHRGKLTLKRLLSTQFAEEIEPYGFPSVTDGWQETRVWCVGCGAHRLLMKLTESPRAIVFRCPHCHTEPETTSVEYPLDNPHFDALMGGLTRPAVILKKGADWSYRYYLTSRTDDDLPCTRCGRPARVATYRREDRVIVPGGADGMYVRCEHCGETVTTSREGLVGALPEVRAFQHEQSRVRIVTRQELEVGGHPAITTTVESATGPARLDVVTDARSYRIVGVYPASSHGPSL